MAVNKNKTLNIIHFNDVYNITESNNDNICGGTARFMTLINKLKALEPEPLIFFSGDFLSPSNISTATKGKHMIPIMNNIGITCGMLGNHDLDYGNEHCIECLQELNYPTLNTNIFTPKTLQENKDSEDESELEPLGKCKKELIIKHHGFNIGLIGVSEDWCNILPIKPKNGIIYKDFIEECNKYVTKIRAQNDLDLVIVLTHSRKENDVLLANKCKGIDLILGGHDHMYHVALNQKNKSLLVKSGCDFKGLTYIQLQSNNTSELNQRIISELNELCLADLNENLVGLNHTFNTFHYNVNRKLEPDAKTSGIVKELSDTFFHEIKKPIGYIDCSLDTRFRLIRKQEMASCNLICDIVRNAYKCDIVLLCGGGIRSDKVHNAGVVSYKDILDIAPFQDPIIIKRIIGKNIINAIKHSIMNLPKLDGRFAHVAGLKYVYDSSREPEDRLINVKVNGYHEMDDRNGALRFVDIEEDKYYTVASRQYTMNGGDGFESLNDDSNEIVMDEDIGLPLCILLRNFFWAITTINDAIKSMNDSNDEELIQDIHRLREKLWFVESVQNDEETKGNMLLKIEAQIEDRIVDITETEEEQTTPTKKETDATIAPFLSPRQYDTLPPFAHMTHKPQRRNSILAFISSLGD